MVNRAAHLQNERAPDDDFGPSEPKTGLVIDPDEREGGLVEDELPPAVGEISDLTAIDHGTMIALPPDHRTSRRHAPAPIQPLWFERALVATDVVGPEEYRQLCCQFDQLLGGRPIARERAPIGIVDIVRQGSMRQ